MASLTLELDALTEQGLRQLSQQDGADASEIAARLLARAVRAARRRPVYDIDALIAANAPFADEDLEIAESDAAERAELLAQEDAIDAFAKKGSQRWLQVAVNQAPDALLDVLRPALNLDSSTEIIWRSPLASDAFREYRDMAALNRLNISSLPKRALSDFWPQRGPVWDALGETSDGQSIFVEAKAHISELASPPSRANPTSLALIQQSLSEAQHHFAPQSNADWSKTFYQYCNRLAHHYLFRTINDLPTHMVFLYFVNAAEMRGPKSEADWRGAITLLHSTLGLEQTTIPGVHEIFLDVNLLKKYV